MNTRELETRGLWKALQTLCALALLLTAGCAANDGSGSSGDSATNGSSEESVRSPKMRELDVQRISSGDRGLEQPQLVAGSSVAALSKETGVRVSGAGDGVYVAAFWGRKTTGGYSVAVRSARVEGDEITVQLALREPPPDAFVAQAITYPYAVAMLRGVDLEGKQLVVESESGRKLGWPVLTAG